MARIKPTPPAFEPKGKKPGKVREDSRAGVPKTARPTAKVLKAPKGAQPAVRVTAGPFFDERHPRSYEGWVVITRAGDVVTYHRFRSEEDARAFATTV